MSDKPAKREHVNEFTCCGKTMTHEAFKAHLVATHGYASGTQCVRTLVLAVDGAGFYHNDFEWEIPCGNMLVKAKQLSVGPRSQRHGGGVES